jgi:hypothetical protein
MDFLKGLLSSRAFWTGLGPVVVAIFNLIGRPLGDAQVQAMTVILSAIAGWAAVTATRRVRGVPTSHRKALNGDCYDAPWGDL